MKDAIFLIFELLVAIARLVGPGGSRADHCGKPAPETAIARSQQSKTKSTQFVRHGSHTLRILDTIFESSTYRPFSHSYQTVYAIAVSHRTQKAKVPIALLSAQWT